METTEMPESTGLIIAKLGVEVFKVISPGMGEWIRTSLTGKTMAIVGPSRAGKTSFANFLNYGILGSADEEQPPTRKLRLSLVKSVIKIGEHQTLELRVRATLDVPGQWDPSWQAEEAVQLRPHAIVVILNVIDDKSEEWLELFLSNMSTQLNDAGNGTRKRLRTLMVLLNYCDLDTTGLFRRTKSDVKSLLIKQLSQVMGRARVDGFQVLPSILIDNPEGPVKVRTAVKALALALA